MIQEMAFADNAEINSSNKVFGFGLWGFFFGVNPLYGNFIPGFYLLSSVLTLFFCVLECANNDTKFVSVTSHSQHPSHVKVLQ